MKKYLGLLLVALMLVTIIFVSVSCNKEPEKPNTYTVTFDTGDGSAVSPVSVEPGKTVTRPSKNPTYKNYTFINWFSDKECTTKYDFKAAVNSDITIYAKWVDDTTYEHSNPILPNGTGQKIPTDWSKDVNGTLGEGLPEIIYNFNGYVKDPDTGKNVFVPVSETNVTAELIAAVKAANANPDYFADTPTNVLFVFSDGWGVTSVDMSREYKGELILDYLPYYTQSKTDSYNKYPSKDYSGKTTTDSPAGGTQVLAGYKTRYGYISLDIDGNIIPNLSEVARENGWKVACVTNDNIADATPAVSIIHDTNRYHSDVLYYKELMATDWDLLMGWDWGMSTYFTGEKGTWASRLKEAAKEGFKDANSREKTPKLPDGNDPIEFFESLGKADQAAIAPFFIYYALWENEDLDKRLNSWQRWTATTSGEAERQAFLTWLDSPQGLAKKIADLDADYGNPEDHVAGRFTSFAKLLANKDFSKPVLGSWTSDGADYEASTPNRGYMLHGTIGKNYPSWPEMVAYTIYQMDTMSNAGDKPTGFFAMIENTCTDGWGHSGNYDTKYKGMMNEVQCFDEGVAIAVKYVLEHPDTLLVITADHETGGYTLREGWEKDITQINSSTTGHSGQNVPLYAFGAGADRFSAESILAQYGGQANAGVKENGFIHEGWVTGAILGQLMSGDPTFGEPANYPGL